MSSQQGLESREVAEKARQKHWEGDSFLRDLFLGRFRLDLIHPFGRDSAERPAFRKFYGDLFRFLKTEVDPVAIDASGEYPREIIDGLKNLGAFGMKIPVEYGGLGLTHAEYVKIMQLLGSHDANLTALLSAHQAIGVPQPVKLFGTEYLKQKYLPRCARGAISAFALTEPAVGSDPARVATTAELSPDGSHYVLNGAKLWCTNGTMAEVIVVIARDPATHRLSCFVVEMGWEGVRVENRCHFMGLKALGNAFITFQNVKVPRENLVGAEGDGLRIALVTLNTGRLSLPAATTGGIKMILEACRKWCNARVQWGVPIGRHEAVAHKLAGLCTTAFAMESLSDLVADLADREGVDIRLEAAAAKEWNTSVAWTAIDDGIQIRGGRGFETEQSLSARGEPPLGFERAMRDSRVNRIFEGSSEIMHLFMAREAVDKHLEVAGKLVDPRATVRDKIRALPKVVAFYLWWYPLRWFGVATFFRFGSWGSLAGHLRFVDRMSRKVAREIFHSMIVYRAALERKQALLFRAVDIAMELFVIAAVVSRARRMADLGSADAESARRIAHVVARSSRRRVRALFSEFWHNDDALKTAFAREVLDGRHTWLERGTVGIGYEAEALRPPTAREILAASSRRRPIGVPRAKPSAAE